MSPKHNVTFANGATRAQSVEVPESNKSTPQKVRSQSQLTNYFRPAHSEIKFGKMKFLITDRPSDQAVESYVSDLQNHRVKFLVRVCEPTYNIAPVTAKGVQVEDWQFVDGQPPPNDVIDKWLKLCMDTFADNRHNEHSIAVHCVAGLGRAPVLVGIALLEAGMKCDDAVFLIRSQRRGALNETQLSFLKQYKGSGRLRKLRYNVETKQRKSCAIM